MSVAEVIKSHNEEKIREMGIIYSDHQGVLDSAIGKHVVIPKGGGFVDLDGSEIHLPTVIR